MMNKMRNLWCFISISPCCLTHFKFSGASKLHDPTTNMKLVQIKDKEKLNRIIKNQPITHVTLLFLCEIQYFFLDFIFDERTFLPFITSDHNNNWDDKKQKKPVETNLILIRNERSAYYGMPPEPSRFFRCYDYRITLLLRHSFSHILKIDQQRFICMDPWIHINY